MEKLVLHVCCEHFWLRALTIAISNHPSSASWPSMSVSADEVAKHNTDKDCWVIVGDQVLDVTNFLSDLALLPQVVVHLERLLRHYSMYRRFSV